MGENRFEQFSISIARIWRSLQRLKTNAMAAFGLRSSHAMCMIALQQAEDGLTSSEISEIAELDKGAVSRAVAELENRGFVYCEREAEKRKYRSKIRLTLKGCEMAEEMNELIDDAVKRAGRGLSDPERDAFEKALSLIAANLQAMEDE